MFRPRLTLAFVEACPVTEFTLGGTCYHDKGLGDFTGFYDWLRDTAGNILGVRYCPFGKTRFLSKSLAPFPYVTVAADKSALEISFARERQVDPSRSDDQAFGDNKVFGTDDGEWAISFNVTSLSQSELESLSATNARWETISFPTDH